MGVYERKRPLFMILFIVFVVLLDQAVKYLVSLTGIHIIHNKGAGFGIFQGKVTFIIFLTLFIVVGVYFLYRYLKKHYSLSAKDIKKSKGTFAWLSFLRHPVSIDLVFVLLVGGAIGNFIDRVFLGGVRDFIHVPFWPSFNVADICITVASIAAIIILLTSDNEK